MDEIYTHTPDILYNTDISNERGLTLSGTSYLSHFGNHMELYIIQKDQILTYSLLQGTFFIGCIAFKQQKTNKFFLLSYAPALLPFSESYFL